MRLGRLEVRGFIPYTSRRYEGATITWREHHWEPVVIWHGKVTFEEREGQSAKQQAAAFIGAQEVGDATD